MISDETLSARKSQLKQNDLDSGGLFPDNVIKYVCIQLIYIHIVGRIADEDDLMMNDTIKMTVKYGKLKPGQINQSPDKVGVNREVEKD